MSLDALRSLALTATFDLMGVDATVTRPAPDDVPVETRGIWLERMRGSSFDEETRAYGTDFQRRDPRKVMAFDRSEMPGLPKGTVIVAPELDGDDPVTWRVDGYARPVESDLMLVNLIRVNDF